MSRPIVVIPACTKLIEGHVFDAVGRKYSAAVAEVAECQPLLVPVGAGMTDIGAILEVADAILLSGSLSNVAPEHYGEETPLMPDALDPLRDALTLPLIRAAVERKTPLFAICRGFQELNVALGGSLYQAVHDVNGHKDHRPRYDLPLEEMYGPVHPVSLRGKLRDWVGSDQIMVNSLHWQGIARLAERLKPEAFAEDGLVEAVRGPDDAAFCLGVQWHPEWAAKSNPVSDIAVPPLRRGGEGQRAMTDTRLTIDEAKAFLDANPGVQWIDAFLFDMNGIPRGKRIRRSDLLGVVKGGLMMPTSVFIMDPLGNCVEETGRLWETGDRDHQCHLLSRTLVPIPVGDGRHAQAVMVVDVKDELDPRSVLVDQVEHFTRAGQTPVAAVELEFYVSRRATNGAFVLQTPEGLSDDPSRPLTFGFEEMDALSPFIDDIYRVCEVQGLPVDAVMKESGPGQFEINLKHRADAVAAALDGLLLKRAVKAAARAHQLDATFMAKPHHDWAGSGMHVHLSLLDKSGQNLFAGDPISPLFRHALGGMRETMADFMAVWAQSANAYRRYVPKAYVSMAAHWGFNNRTVALRIPRGNGAATRIEHRVAGADANPYLVIASILAGMSHGIANKIDPGPAVEGNSEAIEAPPLPTAWVNSLDLFQRSEIVRDAFGAAFQEVFSRLKHAERSNFERIVTPLDHLWYSRVA